MNISKNGIIISESGYSESSSLISIITEDDEVLTSLVKSSKSSISKGKSSSLISGNVINFKHFARENSLGFIAYDNYKNFGSSLLSSHLKNLSMIMLSELAKYLPRYNHKIFLCFYEFLEKYSKEKDEITSSSILLLFLLKLLSILGYGINIERCVVNNSSENLEFVSPKSWHSVSKSASIGYEDKLLPLPKFLITMQNENDKNELKKGVELVFYFLNQKFINQHIKPPESLKMLQNCLIRTIK